MPLEFQVIATIQVCWILVGLWHFIRRSDEVVLLASLMIGYYSGYRMWTLLSGVRQLGSIGNLGFERVDEASAFEALMAIALGQCLMLGTYLLVQNRSFASGFFRLSPALSRSLQSKVITAALILIPLTLYIKGFVAETFMGGFALRISASAYIRLFPLVLSTVAILLIFLWRFGGLDDSTRLLNLGVVGVLFWLTYGSQGRFQFLAWLVAGGLIIASPYRPLTRLALLSAVLVGAAVVFSVAGVQRGYRGDAEETLAFDRIIRAEDANMLEGFALMRQVIPSRYGYRYGMEHLETIVRPIPRAWWPSKPVGNYMLKAMGVDETRPSGTVGISPSLFGSFFVEGGYLGIVGFSLLYGFFVGRFMRWAAGLHPAPGLLVRGLVCASMVPVLRGGDLAGIFAVLAMSFWPFILLLLFRRRELRVDSPWFMTEALTAAPAGGSRRAYFRSGRRGVPAAQR
jgi:hypothetical protein